MPTLTLMTHRNAGDANDDKVGILTTLGWLDFNDY